MQRQTDRLIPTVFTTGPAQDSNNIIPQMFFQFRGPYLNFTLFFSHGILSPNISFITSFIVSSVSSHIKIDGHLHQCLRPCFSNSEAKTLLAHVTFFHSRKYCHGYQTLFLTFEISRFGIILICVAGVQRPSQHHNHHE